MIGAAVVHAVVERLGRGPDVIRSRIRVIRERILFQEVLSHRVDQAGWDQVVRKRRRVNGSTMTTPELAKLPLRWSAAGTSAVLVIAFACRIPS